MWAGWAALFLRQIGHAVLEPPCHEKEALLLGYNTPSKTAILGVYVLIPLVQVVQASSWDAVASWSAVATVAHQWFAWTVLVVLGRALYLVWRHGLRLSAVWVVKLVTDPLTDLLAYSPGLLRRI